MVTGWPNLSNPADNVFFFILGISVTLLFLNTAVMVYFTFRYSRKRNPHPEDVKENTTIEILWTVIPTILVLLIFFAGWKGFQYMRTVPDGAMPVKVVARQWSWAFSYENGRQDGVLRVPVNMPVKLLMTSADVLHSLYIPAYRIKEDCVPGRETYLWFLPDEPGSYDLFCTEYCGVAHADMVTKVVVMSKDDFNAWYHGVAGKTEVPGIPKQEKGRTDGGASLVSSKGCTACHSTDSSTKVGPTFKGLFGKKETVIHDGHEVQIVVDESFIREKLLTPEIRRIKGFPPIMPSHRGQLTDPEITIITDYIKSLK